MNNNQDRNKLLVDTISVYYKDLDYLFERQDAIKCKCEEYVQNYADRIDEYDTDISVLDDGFMLNIYLRKTIN